MMTSALRKVLRRPAEPTEAQAEEQVRSAITKLEIEIATLDDRISVLNRTIAEEDARARNFAKKGDRTAGLRSLQRKRDLEGQVNWMSAQQTALEQQRYALDSTRAATSVIKTVDAGNKAIKVATRVHNVSRMDDVMEDLQENLQAVTELTGAMESVTAGAREGLDDEYEAMAAELATAEVEDAFSTAPPVPQRPIPSSPASRVVSGRPVASLASGGGAGAGAGAGGSRSGARPTAVRAPKEAEEDDDIAALRAMMSN